MHVKSVLIFLCLATVCLCEAFEAKKHPRLLVPPVPGQQPQLLSEKHNEPKIINGTEADWEGTRYQVSLRLKDSDWYFGAGHICGGSLISSDVVLTSAHCMWDYFTNNFRNASDFYVVMGNTNRYVYNQHTLIFNVVHFSTLPTFNVTTYQDDVAVLYLEYKVPDLYPRVYPIALNRYALANGMKCTVSGWGKTETGLYPANLMIADVDIIAKDVCTISYGDFLRTGMVCAGYMAGEIDACTGDTGGPLVCDNHLAGVVSYGVGCAEPGFPGVYADVSYYAAWIMNESGISPTEGPIYTTTDWPPLNGASANYAASLLVFVGFLVWRPFSF